jgi:hypothetical protein
VSAQLTFRARNVEVDRVARDRKRHRELIDGDGADGERRRRHDGNGGKHAREKAHHQFFL